MGYGVPSQEMQRNEYIKSTIQNQAPIYFKGTQSGSSRRNKVSRVDLQSTLSWKLHIDRISKKKANSMLGFLRRNLRSCSEDTKAKAYYGMFRSNLEYCTSIWNPHHKDQTRKLEMVQRRAARYTTNRFRNTSSVSSMLEHLQWESLESRRVKIQLTLFYKVINNLVDTPPADYLVPSTSRTRASHSKRYLNFI